MSQTKEVPANEAVIDARWLIGAHSAGFVRRVAQALGGRSPIAMSFLAQTPCEQEL